jgi:hypothetical protein
MARRVVDILESIKAAQAKRLKAKKKRAKLVLREVKAVDVVKIKEKVKKEAKKKTKKKAKKKVTKVAKKKIAPVKEVKKDLKPLDKTKKFKRDPYELAALTPTKLAEMYDGKFKDMKKVGKQYDVKGSSKIELAHDLINAARKMIK